MDPNKTLPPLPPVTLPGVDAFSPIPLLVHLPSPSKSLSPQPTAVPYSIDVAVTPNLMPVPMAALARLLMERGFLPPGPPPTVSLTIADAITPQLMNGLRDMVKLAGFGGGHAWSLTDPEANKYHSSFFMDKASTKGLQLFLKHSLGGKGLEGGGCCPVEEDGRFGESTILSLCALGDAFNDGSGGDWPEIIRKLPNTKFRSRSGRVRTVSGEASEEGGQTEAAIYRGRLDGLVRVVNVGGVLMPAMRSKL